MVKKILVMDDVFVDAREDLQKFANENGLELVYCAPETREEFMQYFAGNDVLLLVNTWPDSRKFGGYTDEMIAQIAASGVKAVCHAGSGYDAVGDAAVWAKHGVSVSNCPDSPAPETANTAVYLLLGCLRRFKWFTESLISGNWRGDRPPDMPCPNSSVLGILGMGKIGQLIRDRCEPSGYKKILYHQRRELSPDLARGAEFVPDLDEFLRQCDAVVVVVPYTPATHHLLNRERLLNVVKPGVSIVNVARGPLIDESALVEALDSGRVAAVGLDVFENEPEVHPGLLNRDNAILLPHVGALTLQVFKNFEVEAFDFVKQYVRSGEIINQVN